MQNKKICLIDALDVEEGSVFCEKHRITFEKWLERNPHMKNKPPKIVAMVFVNIVEMKGHDFIEVLEKSEAAEKKRSEEKAENKNHSESLEIDSND